MTQVNWSKQAILAGALLVLGTTAYWLEYKHKPQKEAREEQNKKVFDIKDTSVRSIALQDGAGHFFEILCSEQNANLCKPGDNSKWELAQPLKLKADDSNVNALVSALNNLSSAETIDLTEETPDKRASLLKEYGLDANSRTMHSIRKIEIAAANGTTLLYLGASHPIGESIFAIAGKTPAGQKSEGKVDETKVYLVPTYFKGQFDHDLNYWRDKKLMTIAAHEIESFSLAGPKAVLGAERKDGQWTLKNAKGEEFPGDIENIDNVLTAATFLTAKGFVSDKKTDAKAKAALAGTRQVLALSLRPEKGSKAEAPAPVTLALFQKGNAQKGDKNLKLYATVSNLDPLYELDPTSLDRLNKEMKDFRLAKLITSMERFTTKKIELSGKALGPQPLVLKNTDGKWVIEGDKIEPSIDRVQSFLDRLSGNRIRDYLNTIPAGENEGITVKIADEKGDVKRQLVFWKNGATLYARDLGSKRKEAWVIDPSVSDEIPKGRDHFAKKDKPAAGGPAMPQPPASNAVGAPPAPGQPLIPVPKTQEKK